MFRLDEEQLHLRSLELAEGYTELSSVTLNGMLGTSGAMNILLIFPKVDSQCAAWKKAAEFLCLPCNIATASEAAVESFMSCKHDVVIVDRRNVSGFDADGVVKTLRSLSGASYSYFLAVTKSGINIKEIDSAAVSVRQLHDAGYNRRFVENTNAAHCLEELLSIQLNDHAISQKLLAFNSAFAALQHIDDAVEITNDKFQIQYVNPAYERMLGYSSPEEVIGKSSIDFVHPDKNNEEMLNLSNSLQRGKTWTGTMTGRRKSGSGVQLQSTIYPVKGKLDKSQYYVCIKQPLTDRLNVSRENSRSKESVEMMIKRSRSEIINKFRKSSVLSSQSAPTGTFLSSSKNSRKESMARLQSLSVEAPIKKVISLIHIAQENSNANVAHALETVLEILKTTDLYTAELPENNDEMTSDLVGGLMTGNVPSTDKKRLQVYKHSASMPNARPSEVMRDHINQVLEYHSNQKMHSLSEIPEDLHPYLEGDDQWEFDILQLERITNKKPMVYLAMKTMQRFNVCQFLNCSEDTMLNWLQVIQDHYHADNCYHNSTHGADVMQSSAYFLERERIKSVFDEMDEVASLIAALIHDVDHPGRTNPFLINSRHSLAILYNDMSVLESHHVALAFDVTTKDDRINIFKNLTTEEYKPLRQNIIDLVLATEMAKHFEHLSKFMTNIISQLAPKSDDGMSEGNSWTEEEEIELLTVPENKQLIKRLLIKCSDVSNPCRPLKLCKVWAQRIAEEYFQQTDDEKARGLPVVMPNFDRTTCNMPHSQTSFIDFFLKEMFNAWNALVDVPILIENLDANYAYWKQLYDETKRAEQAMQEESTS